MARLVAKSYTQQADIDFSETLSLIAKLTTVRVLLSLAAVKGRQLLQLDINNAFFNGDPFEEVYMDLPLGYKYKSSNLVCKLNKSQSKHHANGLLSSLLLLFKLVSSNLKMTTTCSQLVLSKIL